MSVSMANTDYLPEYVSSPVPSVQLLKCSRDPVIIQALQHLSGSHADPVLKKVTKTPVRVLFKNLATLNRRVKDFDALSWVSHGGQQMIFINERHRNAPPEALAAIIFHEALHDDPYNSIQEEIAGWRNEATLWMVFKKKNPALQNLSGESIPLVKRLNRIEAAYRSGSLDSLVRNNHGYQGLPEHSPGFFSSSSESALKQSTPPFNTPPPHKYPLL